MSIEYKLGINSSTAVTLYPDYDMKTEKKQIRNQHRAKSGRLRLYKWSDYDTINFKVDLVPSVDALVVNSWWDTNTELLFFVTSDTATQVYSVMILNKKTPLNQFNAPYQDHYKGKIILEGY